MRKNDYIIIQILLDDIVTMIGWRMIVLLFSFLIPFWSTRCVVIMRLYVQCFVMSRLRIFMHLHRAKNDEKVIKRNIAVSSFILYLMAMSIRIKFHSLAMRNCHDLRYRIDVKWYCDIDHCLRRDQRTRWAMTIDRSYTQGFLVESTPFPLGCKLLRTINKFSDSESILVKSVTHAILILRVCVNLLSSPIMAETYSKFSLRG